MNTTRFFSKSTLLSRRPLAIALALIAALLLLFAFTNTALACPSCVHFTGCASGMDAFAPVAIPAGAPIVHSSGFFTPTTGDEFAVFRPDDDLCAGALKWAGVSDFLSVWADDSATAEIDGMPEGEVMRWVMWISSTNSTWAANVIYDSTPPLYAGGEYNANRFYGLEVLEPTAVTLSELTAGSPTRSLPALVLVLIFGVALVTGWVIYRKRTTG